MDLSDVLLDEINKSLIAESSDMTNDARKIDEDERSMKERLELSEEDDPFWS